jgi:soluble lytic murein transglycosylase-like protein
MRYGYAAVLLIFVIFIGFVAFVAGTNHATQTASRTTALEDRIRAFIVEKNPQATIKEFDGFARTLLKVSASRGVDYRYVMAIMDKESQFNPHAVGTSGEIGLMQVLPSTAVMIAKAQGWDFVPPKRGKPGAPYYSDLGTLGEPGENIKYGITYLGEQINKFGANAYAFQAYNRGETNAKQHRPSDTYAGDIGKNLVVVLSRFP